MPKIVTQDFQDSQAKRQQKFWKRFYLYRREWNAGETKYEYEETAIEITDWVISSGVLSWQLDTSALNVWKDSNVAVTVKNKKDEWNIDDRDGIFYDKQAKDSKIQIKVGNILPDGTEDLIYVYTGIIKDIKRDNKNQKAIIYLLGYSDILSRYSAEDLLDNQVADETLGTGDGIEVDFYTDEKGVGKIKAIYIDGVEKAIPTDYVASQLNDEDNYAKITFDTAPGVDEIITCDYTYWYQDKKIEYLVKKLLDYALADFTYETLLLDDFSDGDYTSNPTWTIATGTWNASNYYLQSDSAGTYHQIYTSMPARTFGEWKFKINYNSEIGNGEVRFDAVSQSRYYEMLFRTDAVLTAQFRRMGTVLGSFAIVKDSNWHTVVLQRNIDYTWKIYYDDVLKITANDAYYKNLDRIKLIDQNYKTNWKYDDFYYPTTEWELPYEVDNVVFDNLVLANQIWNSEAEFNACQTKQELEVLAEGSVRQVQSQWLETVTADFAAGVTKDNIDTSGDEIKLTTVSENNQLSTKDDENGAEIYDDGYNYQECKQTFAPSVSGYFYKARFRLYSAGSGQVQVTFAGITSNIDVIAGTNWYEFDIATYNIVATAESTYELYITAIETEDIYWRQSDNDNYARGAGYYRNSTGQSTWAGTGKDFVFEIYIKRTGHFRSQEKTLGGDSCLGKFLESHLAGQNYSFKVRSYDGAVWGEWLTVSDEQNIGSLTPADKIQYDIILYSEDGTTNPKVTDVAINYVDQGYTDTHCKLVTQDIDCGTSLEAFGLFEKWYLLYGKELKFYTQSSEDGTDWESEKEISGNGQINSTCIPETTRHLRGIVYFKTDDATIRPLLQKIKLNWAISKIEIALANFTGLTVKKAIEDLAEMPDYEIGFNAVGKYFFRKKIVDINIDCILDDRNIKEFLYIDDGFGRVANYIEAKFGDYSKIISTRLEEETRPDSIDKYGERRLVISGGNLLGAGNIDIATGIAMRYYGFYSSNYSLTSLNYPNPKLRCRVKTKFIPQIDLSDTISLTFPIYKERKYAYLFDGFCFDDFVFGTSSLAFDGKLMKVIGIVLDLENWYMELLLEEI